MEYNIEFSYAMCCYTAVPHKGTFKNQPSRLIHMERHRVTFRWNLLYLGETIDAHLRWMTHLTSVQEKAFKVLHKMNHFTAANWGLRPKLHKMLYAVVAGQIILYAAPIWYNGKVPNR